MFVDEELALASGLVAHEGVQGDVAEAMVSGEASIVPSHGMFDIFLIFDTSLPRLHEVGHPSRLQSRAHKGQKGL